MGLEMGSVEPSIIGNRPCDAAYRIGIHIDMLRAFISGHAAQDFDIDGLLDSLNDEIEKEFSALAKARGEQ